MKGPSRTAWGVAVHRAAHQTLESGNIFADPFARAILGPDADDHIARKSDERTMRLFVCIRARFAEDSLAAAHGRGVRQAVVLGAGLDTFALRNPFPDLAVFEVDHPGTQDWKRRQLARIGAALPGRLRFAPVDFECEELADGLARAGFDAHVPAFFIWLGVVPYLTRTAILSTLDFIAAIPQGEVVFDYPEPLRNYPVAEQPRIRALAARVAALGEPFLSDFDPPDLHRLLRAKGFDEIEDLGSRQFAIRYFDRPEGPDKPGGHVLRARRTR